MGKVRIHNGETMEWVTLRSLYPARMAETMADAELDSTMANHEAGLDGSLNLAEFKYLPHATFELHAHDRSEIIYVIDGSILLGNRELGPGSSVFIEAHTLYGFSAGADGLRALIFMADGRASYWNATDFEKKRAELATA